MELEPRATPSGVGLTKSKQRKRTLASVFIVESVDFEDERAGRLEGDVLSQILQLSGKESEYFYIRTRRSSSRSRQFAASRMRYLHLSCHGNSELL